MRKPLRARDPFRTSGRCRSPTTRRLFGDLEAGKPVDQDEKDCDRDNFMSADEAKNYGLVDEVVQSRKEIPALTATDKEKAQKEGSATV